MIVEIVSTGEEVLSGQIVDTNASWICAHLSEQGIETSRRFTVGDRLDDLANLFKERSVQADVIIVTGGLGPTSDDLSAVAMAQAKDEPTKFFQEWWDTLEKRFSEFNRPLDPQNKKQATLPESAVLIDNPIGTACGFKLKINKAQFYLLPGVPSEMKKMFAEHVLSDIIFAHGGSGQIEVQVFQSLGYSESTLGRMLAKLELPKSISLGFRPRVPTVEIKMISRSATKAEKDDAAQKIRECLGERLYAESSQTLAQKIQEIMIQRKKTLAVAESCTGGMISSQIVDVAGSSEYFDRGYVTYSYRAKTELLDVPAALIEEKGAVSEEVALQMAKGARDLSGCDYALAVSGISGPSGGTEDKPVGTVVFSLATPEREYVQTLFLPPWGRQRVRKMSAAIALDMLRRELLGFDVLATLDLVKKG